MLLCSQANQGLVKIHIRELLSQTQFWKGGVSSMTLYFTAGVWKWGKLTPKALQVDWSRGHLGAPTLDLQSCWFVRNTKVTCTELIGNVWWQKTKQRSVHEGYYFLCVPMCCCFRDTAGQRQQVIPRNIPFLCLGHCDVYRLTVMDSRINKVLVVIKYFSAWLYFPNIFASFHVTRALTDPFFLTREHGGKMGYNVAVWNFLDALQVRIKML